MHYIFTLEIFQIIFIIYSIYLIFNRTYLCHSNFLMQLTTYWLMAHGVVHSLLLTANFSSFDNGWWHHVFELLFVLLCFFLFRHIDWIQETKGSDHAFEWPIVSLLISMFFFIISFSDTYFDMSPAIPMAAVPLVVILASTIALFYLLYLKLYYEKLKISIVMNGHQFHTVSELVNQMTDEYRMKLDNLSQPLIEAVHLDVFKEKLNQSRIAVYSDQLELAALLSKPKYKAHIQPSWVTLNDISVDPVLLTLFFELLIQILIAEDLNLQLRIADHPLKQGCWTIDFTPSKSLHRVLRFNKDPMKEEVLHLLMAQLKFKLDLSIEQDNHYWLTIYHVDTSVNKIT